jgi:hypothetical protein
MGRNRRARLQGLKPPGLRSCAAGLKLRPSGSSVHKMDSGQACDVLARTRLAFERVKCHVRGGRHVNGASPAKRGRRYPSIPHCGAACGKQDLGMNRALQRDSLRTTHFALDDAFFCAIFWAMCNSNVWLPGFIRPISLRKRSNIRLSRRELPQPVAPDFSECGAGGSAS